MQFPAEKYKAAGLNTTDVAVLFKVTRTTASNWLRGRGVHSMMRDTVEDTTGQLDRAVANGELPWKPAKRGSAMQRAYEIRSLVMYRTPRG